MELFLKIHKHRTEGQKAKKTNFSGNDLGLVLNEEENREFQTTIAEQRATQQILTKALDRLNDRMYDAEQGLNKINNPEHHLWEST